MKKLMKQVSAMALALVVCFSQTGMSALASNANRAFTEPTIELISVEETIEETTEAVVEETTETVEEATGEVVETTEETVEETIEETSEETTETVAETTEETVEETAETVEETTETVEETTETVEETTETVEETTETVEETTETAEETEDLFPGLGSASDLSKAQIANKEELSSFAKTIGGYEPNVDYVEGEILVDAETLEDAEKYAEAYNGVLAGYNENRKIARIELAEGVTVQQAVSASKAITTKSENAVVLPAAWPNYLSYTCEEDTDVELEASVSGISGYNDTSLASQWYHEYMGSEYAWAEGYTGAGVTVAVIDTGIRKTHQDLSANTVNGKAFIDCYSPSDVVEVDNNDYKGHGSHVAGIIAADGNNSYGGSGVAPDAKVRSYRVFGSSGGASTWDIIYAVDAAVADGNDIINMSLGGPGYYKPYHNAVKDAIKSGVAVFVAAGNENSNGGDVYPANFKEACTIGALNLSGGAATFSNYGSHVDLAFPGVDIYSTYNQSDSSYTNMNGTSMATPAAAGAAAVILSAQPSALKGKKGSAKVNALVKIMQTAAKKSSSSGMGKGTTYLPKALGLSGVDGTPVAPKFNMAKGTYTTESISVKITAETGKKIYYSTNGKNPTFKNGVATNATLYTGPVTITGAANVTLKAIAVNTNGKTSKVASAKYTLKPKQVNTVTLTQANNIKTLAQGKNFTLKTTFAPAYATDKAVDWSVSPAGTGVTVKNGKVTASKNATTGSYTVTAKMKNYGTVYATYTFTVIESKAMTSKVALETTKATLTRKPGEVSPIVNLGSGVTITYANGTTATTAASLYWSSNKTSVATVSSSGVVTALSAGSATITAMAKDGSGKKATAKITVVDNVTSIVISGSDDVAKGKSITLKATVTPAKSKNAKLNWTITPAGTGVTVKNGKVTASKNATTGTYTVKAATKDGSVTSAAFSVKVVDAPITKIAFANKSETIFSTAGAASAPTTIQLKPVVTGGDASLVEYKSSAPGVATVSRTGLVTAKAPGKTTITCASTDGSNKKATVTINVNVPMSAIKIAPKGAATQYVAVGGKVTYGALIYNAYGAATNSKVTWEVANTSIATVDKNSGTVKGVATGTTQLIARAADGCKVYGTYNITVVKAPKYFTLEVGDYTWYSDAFELILVLNTDAGIIDYTAGYTVSISNGKNASVYDNYTNAVDLLFTKSGTYTVKVKLLDGSNKTATYKLRLRL